ncbi:Protein CBG20016 [Caenorhabditis briggsae]|uniref:Protein CBG20016 n=1 Tax=Caenorhabditis briggsae TaxID=6238 RepID=A8XWY0_CAEBR|nr:Protein CBG20016 [Caenorhabditis briggsae]CAP37149.2 Protein CBG20016 [Caenorhabditis briggsae]
MDKGGSIANEFSQTKDGQRFLVKDEQYLRLSFAQLFFPF